MRLPFIGSMPSATCLCFVAILTLTSVFLPTLSQVTTNKSHTQMAKRSLSSFVGESSSMRGSTINWRFSLGHTNAAHTGLGPSTPKPTRQNSGNRTSWRPKVTIIGDNLAVNLSWPSRSSRQRPLSHYRIQFRYRDPHRRHWVRTPVVVQTRLAGNVLQPYLYVTNKQPGGLEAGKVYQFQVVAVLPDANAPEEKSRWSAITSFEYIYADSPLVRVARRLPDGTVLINWSRSWGQNAFRITRFIILFRKEKRLPNGETVFHGFRHVTAPGNLEAENHCCRGNKEIRPGETLLSTPLCG
uniref:Fibronectin type-III domain-containing protein n=1 Tax=Mesocestoides corti TaxID=53468 RepID=A0A5K3EPM2_MESCO